MAATAASTNFCIRCQLLDLYTLLVSTSSPRSLPTGPSYFRRQSDRKTYFSHSKSIRGIRQSAAAGCAMCQVLEALFRKNSSAALREEQDLPVLLAPVIYAADEFDFENERAAGRRSERVVELAPSLQVLLLDAITYEMIPLGDLSLSIEKETWNDAVELPFKPLHKVNSQPDSKACMRLAHEWLRICVNTHDCTRKSQANFKVGPRFLNIGTADEEPFLENFDPDSVPHHWVALSYVWGDKRNHDQFLTTQTHESLNQGLQLENMDATIRDAIIITRNLGIQHLWVDALCIIQDDELDKSRQSAQMHEIYGSSTLTIVPADSSSAQQGIFQERRHHYARLSWTKPSALQSQHRDHYLGDICISTSSPPFAGQVDNPWNTRGWTLQEGLLPHRLLLYNHQQMIWKCCHEKRDESGNIQYPLKGPVLGIVGEIGTNFSMELEKGTDYWSLDLYTQLKSVPWLVDSPECATIHGKYRVWDGIIEDYSRRLLTEPTDRLTALSGLARFYEQSISNGVYMAGLWREDLVRGLLWHVPDEAMFDAIVVEGSRNVLPGLPSWSWAQVKLGTGVENDWTRHSGDITQLARIQDVVQDLVIEIAAPTFHFSHLYDPSWRFHKLTAMEKHIYTLVEEEYPENIRHQLSKPGCYAALMMVQSPLSFDLRRGVLITQLIKPTEQGSRRMLYRRVGVILLRHFDRDSANSDEVVAIAQQIERDEYALDDRLPSDTRRRRKNAKYCNAVYDEYQRDPWPVCTLSLQ